MQNAPYKRPMARVEIPRPKKMSFQAVPQRTVPNGTLGTPHTTSPPPSAEPSPPLVSHLPSRSPLRYQNPTNIFSPSTRASLRRVAARPFNPVSNRPHRLARQWNLHPHQFFTSLTAPEIATHLRYPTLRPRSATSDTIQQQLQMTHRKDRLSAVPRHIVRDGDDE